MKKWFLSLFSISVYVVCHTDDEKVHGLQVFLSYEKALEERERLLELYMASRVYFGSKRVI